MVLYLLVSLCQRCTRQYIESKVLLEWRTDSALTRMLFWCLFPSLRSNEGNKHQHNARASTETIRHESTHIILFLTRHNESVIDDTNDDLYISFSSLTCSVFILLMTSQSIADGVTMTWQLWRDHMISNSLDIDFIHGDIHGRSYKKHTFISLSDLHHSNVANW